MRFHEFYTDISSDTKIDEDMAASLDRRENQLDNQKKVIDLRKKALANRKAQQNNQAKVRKMAKSHIDKR